MQRFTVGEAARILGVGMDAIRKRIARGTIETTFEDGKRYVLLQESETGRDTGTDKGRDTDLVDELRAHNETLRAQLEAAHERDRENRRIIAALTQRIPEIEAPASPQRESPVSSNSPGPGRCPYRPPRRRSGAHKEAGGAELVA
jgi:hypothetical protein